MRITRIRLRNYRGIDEREIELAPVGVTVVQGPNEIGKSSIAEGLSLLLEHLDSSARREIKDIKPVGRDVGPEVEVDMETGPYAFTYRKRFLRDRETVLRVTRPAPVNLSGREAHERVQAMLEETLDPSLWKALRITQGSAITDVKLGGIASLSVALDAAAGSTPAGDTETSLYDRARAEYGRYWTDTGRPRAEAAELRDALTARRASLDQIETALRSLEGDVESVARLHAERGRIDEQRARDEQRTEELREGWHKVEGIQKQVETVEARLEGAQLASERGGSAVVGREALIARVAADTGERDKLVAATERAAPALKSARERVEEAGEGLAGAADARVVAERALTLLRGDVEQLRDQASIAALRDQRDRLREARAGLAEAEAALATNKVDETALDGVRAASIEVQTARARQEAGSPTVAIKSLGAQRIELDGATLDIAPGASEERPVIGQLRVEVPGAVRLDISSGADGEALGRALASAERSFAEACQQAGVDDLAAAEAAAVARREAEAARKDHRRTIDLVLVDLDLDSADALDPRIAVVEGRISTYEQERSVEPAMPSDVEAARAGLAPAEHVLEAARAAEEHARTEDGAARAQLAKYETAATEVDVRLQVAGETLTASEDALARAREASSDEELADRRQTAETAEVAAAEAAREARATLDAEGPEALRTRLDNAEAVLAGSNQRLREVEDQLLEVLTRLRDHQEDGLSEQQDKAIVARDLAARELTTYERRAAARKLLYETLKSAREAAHRAYVGPLRERIEELGRVVYGESLRVEMSEDLRITSRTLSGDTVPFDSLSVGTKEQLGVIARLACAIIVADDEGAPVILDDTLGFSDPGRLEAMGAVLGMAGNSCQVIALTCYPDRYRHVGGATIRRLG